MAPFPSDRLVAVLGTGIVDSSTPVIRANDPGISRGDGCFEGCRLIADAAGPRIVDKLEAHLARFARSAGALGIPFDDAPWRQLIDVATAAWTLPGEAAMRLFLTRGVAGLPTGFLMIEPLSAEVLAQRRDGIRVIILERGYAHDAFAAAPWLLGGIKTLSYAINMAALREAERRSADDVIFVSSDRLVLEAPTASVVWTVGREMFTTPTGASGILAGTTQQRLFVRADAAGWHTSSAWATVDELHAADGLWLVSSVRGPSEVIELDGKEHPRDAALTATIRDLAGF